jgi:hypothetical protein
MTDEPQPPASSHLIAAGQRPPDGPAGPAATAAARHLDILAILHYVVGGVTALFGLIGLPYIPLGYQLMESAQGELPEVFREAGKYVDIRELEDPENRAIVGAATLTIGVVVTTIGFLHGAILAYIGRCIARRRRRGLVITFSIFDLTYLIPLPLGTALSIYALCVLFRRPVVELFRTKRP